MGRGDVVAVFAVWLGVTGGCAGSSALRMEPRTDDPGIANLAALRMSSDPRLCRYDVTVVVTERNARLEGKVSGSADRRRAEKIARDAGAVAVEDQLSVDPAAAAWSDSKC